MSSADEWIQEKANPGGRGLPVTADTLAELLVRVSTYGIAVRDHEEDVMGFAWGHVSTLIHELGVFAGLEPDAVYAVYRSEVARLELPVE